MKRKIILIEDNAQNRYLVTYLLERAGHEVVSAESGPAGIDLADRIRPDLIVLDIQLPGMDGYAVARGLKGKPELHAVPIVAVTSYAMVGDREKAIGAGCDGYMEKPIDPETFVADIERFLLPEAEGPGR